jgi:ferric-dicitrate binding protein FerR (iron transport regulator)
MNKEEQIPEELKGVWGQLEHSRTEQISVSEQETESALSEVWSRIDQREAKQAKAPVHQMRRYFSAAAAILLAVGLGYLFIPVTIEAPLGEITTVELTDKSKVTLNAGSSIRHNRLFNIANRNIRLQGEAFFDVASSSAPFNVNTNDASVTVLGTRFNVDAWNTTKIAVEEGLVSFSPATGVETKLKAGEKAVWDGQKVIRSSDALENDLAWLEGHFAFSDASLNLLFSELSRSYGIQIDLQMTTADESSITAYYNRPDNPEFIIRDICQVKGLKYRKTLNGFIIEE